MPLNHIAIAFCSLIFLTFIDCTSVKIAVLDDSNKQLGASISGILLNSVPPKKLPFHSQLLHLKYVAGRNASLSCGFQDLKPTDEAYVVLISNEQCRKSVEFNRRFLNKSQAIIVTQSLSTMFITNSNNKAIYDDVPTILVYNNDGKKMDTLIMKTRNSDVYVKVVENKNIFPILNENTYMLSILIFSLAITLLVVFIRSVIVKFEKSRSKKKLEQFEEHIKGLLQNSISKMKFKLLGSNSPELTENCTICLNRFEVNDKIRVLHCGHIFHLEEIDTWLFQTQKCPICKADMIEYTEIKFTAGGFFNRQVSSGDIELHSIASPVHLASYSNRSLDS